MANPNYKPKRVNSFDQNESGNTYLCYTNYILLKIYS
jgi:hypothetical protein